MHIDSQSEHGWQALRYAARHLTAAEHRAFENRLAEDQTAREAVAQAVELAHTATFLHLESEPELAEMTAVLRGAPTTSALDAVLLEAAPTIGTAPQRPATASWTARAGWWSAAVAASLALVALWSAIQNRPQPVLSTPNTEQVASAVTSAWAALNSQRLVLLELPNATEEVAVDNLGSLREVPRESEEALVLDWLLNGLRQEGMTAEPGSEIQRTN